MSAKGQEETMSQVIIGMDPHKRSATIEVMTADEVGVAGGGRYGTDAAGLAAMLAAVRRWPERTWAVEGSRGVGRQLASWLVAAGEQVVDVPPKLSARTRVFTAGQRRKTDATDAHAIALAPPAARDCTRSPMTRSWRCCGSWRTGGGRWARITPGCVGPWFGTGSRSREIQLRQSGSPATR
jgi:Transposase